LRLKPTSCWMGGRSERMENENEPISIGSHARDRK
jgi:hypothetical protein